MVALWTPFFLLLNFGIGLEKLTTENKCVIVLVFVLSTLTL